MTLLERAAHLIFLGVELDATGEVRMDGNLELLATREGVAVLATDLPESLGPQALRKLIMPLLGTSATAGTVVGLVVSQVLDALSRPVHAAAVGIQPLTRGFEELDEGDLDVAIVAALIPTILFSLYGTNFEHVPLLGETWGYWVMLGLTFVLCGFTWWRLRVADWI